MMRAAVGVMVVLSVVGVQISAQATRWTRQLGTSGRDEGRGIAVDGSGNVYVTGETAGGLDGNPSAGGKDAFIWALADEDDTVLAKGEKPPLLRIGGVTFADQDNDNILSGDETAALKVAVVNASGAGRARKVVCMLIPEQRVRGVSHSREVKIGTLEPGGRGEATFTLTGGEDIVTATASFIVRCTEGRGFDAEEQRVVLRTRAVAPPEVRVVAGEMALDDRFEPQQRDKLAVGTGNNVVEPGESVEVRLPLENRGAGATRGTRVRIRSSSPDAQIISTDTFVLGTLNPGERRHIQFAVAVSRKYTGTQGLGFTVSVSDERRRFSREETLTLPVNRPMRSVQTVEIQGKPVEVARSAVPESRPARRSTMTVAVADFSGQDVSAAEAATVAGLIRTELVNMGVYRVVDRGNMDKILAEVGYQMSGCTETGCAVEMGKHLNVTHMIVGTVSRLGETYIIMVNVVEMETAQIVRSYRQTAENKRDLINACSVLAQTLAAE